MGNATSRPCTISGVFVGHQITLCYSHLTVYLSPVNVSVVQNDQKRATMLFLYPNPLPLPGWKS